MARSTVTSSPVVSVSNPTMSSGTWRYRLATGPSLQPRATRDTSRHRGGCALPGPASTLTIIDLTDHSPRTDPPIQRSRPGGRADLSHGSISLPSYDLSPEPAGSQRESKRNRPPASGALTQEGLPSWIRNGGP